MKQKLRKHLNLIKCNLFIFCSLTIISVNIKSQTDTVKLRNFEITAKKPLGSITTTTLDSLDKLIIGLSSINDKLNLFTPLFIKEYSPGGISTAAFRGTSASHTLVLFDGFSVNPGMNGQGDFSAIAPFLFDKIEIFSGLQSMNLSQGAFGGIISLNTAPYAEQKTQISLRLDAGSFRNFGYGLLFSQKHKNWTFRTRVFQNSADNNFKFVNNSKADYTLEHRINASFNKKGLMQEIYNSNFKRHLSLKFYYIDNYNQLPAPLLQNQIDENEFQNNEIIRLIFGGRFKHKNNSFSIKAKVSKEEWNYNNLSSKIFSENKIYSSGFIGDYILNFKNKSEFKSEIYSHYQEVETNNYSENKTQTTNRISNYYKTELLKININLINHLVLQNNKIYTTPAIILSKEIKDKILINISNGRNIRLPSFNDLFWYPGGNPNLKAEEAFSHELLLVYQFSQKWNTQINFSHSRVKNWILWQPTSNISIWQPENIGKVHSSAIDFNNNLIFKAFGIDFESNQSYSYCTSIDKTDNESMTYNKQLIYVPFHNSSITFKVKKNQKYINLESHYTGKRFTRLDNKSYMPSHFNHNLYFGIEKEKNKTKCEILFGINNLTSENYQVIAWQPMPKRHFKISLRFSFFEK